MGWCFLMSSVDGWPPLDTKLSVGTRSFSVVVVMGFEATSRGAVPCGWSRLCSTNYHGWIALSERPSQGVVMGLTHDHKEGK